MAGFRDIIDGRRGLRLQDADGNAASQSALEEIWLEPNVMSMRSPFSGHPAEGLNPLRLAEIHRNAANGDPTAYLELAEDIEERDLHYFGVMNTRKRSVSQLPITVEAASQSAEHKKHAELVQSWINDDVLRASLFDMLDAIGKGFSVMEIDWRMHMGHMCPRELIHRPQRWFKPDRRDGETLLLRELREDRTLHPAKFVIHRHKSKSGLTIRSGIARVASWAWMYKQFTGKDWAIFVQNFGMPLRVGKYATGATEQQKAVLWKAVKGIAGDCAAIIPAGMEIIFQEVAAKAASAEIYEKRSDWMDRQVSKAVLGQTTTTDAVSGGHAVAQEHRLVQEDIERSDAIIASATVNQQIVPNLVAFNFGPQELYPKVRIGRPDEVPLKIFADAFDKLGKQGLKLPAAWVRGRLGAPAPVGDEETIGGHAPAAVGHATEEELPAKNARRPFMLVRHTRAGDELAEKMTTRLEEDAAGALAGLSAEIRAALEEATDIRDAADRLAALQLDPEQLAQAMARGMALAHLAGQAAVIDDMARRK